MGGCGGRVGPGAHAGLVGEENDAGGAGGDAQLPGQVRVRRAGVALRACVRRRASRVSPCPQPAGMQTQVDGGWVGGGGGCGAAVARLDVREGALGAVDDVRLLEEEVHFWVHVQGGQGHPAEGGGGGGGGAGGDADDFLQGAVGELPARVEAAAGGGGQGGLCEDPEGEAAGATAGVESWGDRGATSGDVEGPQGSALADVLRGEAHELARAEADDVAVADVLVDRPAGGGAGGGEEGGMAASAGPLAFASGAAGPRWRGLGGGSRMRMGPRARGCRRAARRGARGSAQVLCPRVLCAGAAADPHRGPARPPARSGQVGDSAVRPGSACTKPDSL